MPKKHSLFALGAAAVLLLILILSNIIYIGRIFVPLYDSISGMLEAFGTISRLTMPLTAVLAVTVGLMGFKLINEKLAYSIIAVIFTYGFICAFYDYVNDSSTMGGWAVFHIQSLSLMLSQLMPVILCFIGVKKKTLKGIGGVLLCLVPAISFLTFFISWLFPWYQAYLIDIKTPEYSGMWNSFFEYYYVDYLSALLSVISLVLLGLFLRKPYEKTKTLCVREKTTE